MYQLSCLISHVRCTRKIWKPTMKIFIRQDREIEITDYNYMHKEDLETYNENIY